MAGIAPDMRAWKSPAPLWNPEADRRDHPFQSCTMTENLTIGLIGTLAGSVAANGHPLLTSRNPVLGAVSRLLRWYAPRVTSHVTRRVNNALGAFVVKLGTSLAGVHPLGRLVPGVCLDVAWPLTKSPLSTAFHLGVHDRNVAYTAGRLLSHLSGTGAVSLALADLAYWLGARSSWLFNVVLRIAQFVRSALKVGLVAAVLLATCLFVRWWTMRRWRTSALEPVAQVMLNEAHRVALEDIDLDEQVENHGKDEEDLDEDAETITEQEIPRIHPTRFIRRCALWCKANFTCTPGRLSEAQFIVVRESLARELRRRNVRNVHIANVLDAAVHLAFVPTDLELEGAKLLNSDLFKARRAETAVARTSWWSFICSKVYLLLGHQGAINLVA